MNAEEKIISLCLYGFIKRESPQEQHNCLKSIEGCYGVRIAGMVREHLKT